ncbi:MAG: EscU/YscU/HrcU family type III secretion system export apparatus switch protein [Acidimicrobiales bacterium]
MAGGDKYSRTEPPTPKRKKEARQDGQVARSPDVSGWLAILVGTMLLPWLFGEAEGRVLAVTSSAVVVMRHPTVTGALAVLEGGLRQVLIFSALLGGILMAIGVVANVAQVGRAASIKAARPRFTRLNPKAGFQRLFSPKVGWELAKQVLKLGVLAAVGYGSLRTLTTTVGGKSPATLAPLLDYAGASLLSFIRTVAVIGLLLGVLDFGVQRHRMSQSLKMTKQEVKDERRSQEGDPMMKGRLRRQQYAIARSRVMAAVRTADVVVANPTHFAVALQYDPGRGGAPRVVAKGVDGLALRIREEAARHGVAVVEDPPLARYLHATCEVEQQVPAAVYVAVARLIAFVYSLEPARRGASVHRRPYSVVPELAPGTRPVPAAVARRRRRAAASPHPGGPPALSAAMSGAPAEGGAPAPTGGAGSWS